MVNSKQYLVNVVNELSGIKKSESSKESHEWKSKVGKWPKFRTIVLVVNALFAFLNFSFLDWSPDLTTNSEFQFYEFFNWKKRFLFVSCLCFCKNNHSEAFSSINLLWLRLKWQKISVCHWLNIWNSWKNEFRNSWLNPVNSQGKYWRIENWFPIFI